MPQCLFERLLAANSSNAAYSERISTAVPFAQQRAEAQDSLTVVLSIKQSSRLHYFLRVCIKYAHTQRALYQNACLKARVLVEGQEKKLSCTVGMVVGESKLLFVVLI